MNPNATHFYSHTHRTFFEEFEEDPLIIQGHRRHHGILNVLNG
jgi:hypothetical protein